MTKSKAKNPKRSRTSILTNFMNCLRAIAIKFGLKQQTAAEKWINTYKRLFRGRIIFLADEIDEAIANAVMTYMLYLDSEEPNKPIYLYINSPGGSLNVAMSIYDTMQHIRADVATICVGLAAGTAAILLSSGTKGKRLILPHAKVGLCQFRCEPNKIDSDLADIKQNQQERVKKEIINILADNTGQTTERIASDIETESFFHAQMAQEYGFVDHIIGEIPG